ncbi:MAG TPA: hypothetical protein VMG10_36065 [Gemmataceae bacterium]|nr:hypothetical protein [Gemmataceae bacterium]
MAVVGCSHLQKGRIVAWADWGFLAPDALARGDSGRLLLNAVAWSAGSKKSKVRVGLFGADEPLAFLKSHNQDVKVLTGPDWFKGLHDIDVLIAGSWQLENDDARSAVTQHIAAGGGFLTADVGWMLANDNQPLNTYWGNQLLHDSGLRYAEGWPEFNPADGFKVTTPPAAELNVGLALDAMLAAKDRKRKLTDTQKSQYFFSLRLTLAVLPRDDRIFLARLRKLRAKMKSIPVPSVKTPIKNANGLVRALIALDVYDMRNTPPQTALQANASTWCSPR